MWRLLFTIATILSISCGHTQRVSFQGAPRRFPARPSGALVTLIDQKFRDASIYFANELRRPLRHFLLLGVLHCVGRGCASDWQRRVALHGAHILHRRCGVADAAGWESKSIVASRLSEFRLTALDLKAGQYGCTGSLFVDLFRVDDTALDPELRLLAKVLRSSVGWRDSLTWLRHKYRSRFSAGWFVANAPVVHRVAGPIQELDFLRHGILVNRDSHAIQRLLSHKRYILAQRRAVLSEPSLQWVHRVVRVSSRSRRYGESPRFLAGQPGVIPTEGNYKRAWTSWTRRLPAERIEVQFRRAVVVDGLRVVEATVPVRVAAVHVLGPSGRWVTLWRGGKTGPRSLSGVVHKIAFVAPPFAVKTVALDLFGYAPFHRVELDAVAIHGNHN